LGEEEKSSEAECTPNASTSGPVGEWEFLGLGGKNVGDVAAVAVDPCNPRVIYAGSQFDFSGGILGKLFRSTDGGETWDTLRVEQPGRSYTEIKFAPSNPDILYAAHRGILKSTDGGKTWKQRGLGGDPERWVSSLAIHPEEPDIVYAGKAGFFSGRLYKSTDGGQDWNLVAPEMPSLENVTAIAIDRRNPAVLCAGADGAVYKSTDAGQTWEQSLEGIGQVVYHLLIDSRNSQVVYTGLAAERTIMKSMSGGRTWKSFSKGLPDSAQILKIVQRERALYLGASTPDGGGIYRRSTGEERWTRIGIPDVNLYSPVDLEIGSQGKSLYVGLGEGVYRFQFE
jgi:photosystem II stability/assembly factor-like uncharacterized protein